MSHSILAKEVLDERDSRFCPGVSTVQRNNGMAHVFLHIPRRLHVAI